MPERIPPTKKTTPITGEAPRGLLDSIVKDLAERTGATFENITVIQDQAIVWNDGSLGCAQPGEFYTQVTVNGYWVILEIDRKQYDYRATDRGYYFLCEGRLASKSSHRHSKFVTSIKQLKDGARFWGSVLSCMYHFLKTTN